MTGHLWGHTPGGVGLRHLLHKLAGKMLLITVHVLPFVLFLCWAVSLSRRASSHADAPAAALDALLPGP